MLSVKPSDRYSVSGSRFWLTNGKTAIESIATSVLRARRYIARAMAPATSATAIKAAASLCCLIPEIMNSALDAGAIAADVLTSPAVSELTVEPTELGGVVV